MVNENKYDLGFCWDIWKINKIIIKEFDLKIYLKISFILFEKYLVVN